MTDLRPAGRALEGVVADLGGGVHGLLDVALLQDLPGAVRVVAPHAGQAVGLQLDAHLGLVAALLAGLLEHAEHVGAPSTNALRKWVHRYGVPYFLYGKRMRFLRRDLDEAVGNTTRRRNRGFQSQASRFVQSQGSPKRVRLSPQDVGVVHGESVNDGANGEQGNSRDRLHVRIPWMGRPPCEMCVGRLV